MTQLSLPPIILLLGFIRYSFSFRAEDQQLELYARMEEWMWK